jgi:hypothetical protein
VTTRRFPSALVDRLYELQQLASGSRCNRMKNARVILHIEPALKAAGEKAAVAEHRSLTGLIEKLLTDYCKKHDPAGARSSGDEAPKAAEMAASTIDDIGDKTLPPEEHQRRKRRLIRGPKEFRDMRRK